MSHTIINPAELHDPSTFGYSHTASVPGGSELVFISGQYGSGADGMLTDPGFAEQVQQSFANLATALAAHGLEMSHVVQLRTYIVGLDFEALGIMGATVGGIWGDQPPTQTVLGAAALAMPDMRFEVEAVAARS